MTKPDAPPRAEILDSVLEFAKMHEELLFHCIDELLLDKTDEPVPPGNMLGHIVAIVEEALPKLQRVLVPTRGGPNAALAIDLALSLSPET